MSSSPSSHEQTQNSAYSQTREKRKRNESMDSTQNDAKRVLDLIYGKEAVGCVLLTGKDTISLNSVNKLILSILVESSLLSWATIRGRPLIKKCVLVHCCGIDAELWEEKKKTSLKSIHKIFDNPIMTLANHATTKAVQGVGALLSVHSKTKEKRNSKKNQKRQRSNQSSPCTFPDLLATKEQLLKFGFLLDGSIDFKKTPKIAPRSVEIAALDCEMCETVQGSELTRMSLVDVEGVVLVDTLVKPALPITNYLTPFSGITPQMMKEVDTTLEEAQELFCSFIGEDTILVGHSLENDLTSLKICHSRIVDTVMLYPHPGGFPRRSSLKYLASRHLKRTIQDGSHDSILDAQIALELAKLKTERGREFGVPTQGPRELRNLTEVLSEKSLVSCLIDRTAILTRHGNEQSHEMPCTSDQEVRQKLMTQIKKPDLHFIWAQFQDLYRFWIANSADQDNSPFPEGELDEILMSFDKTVQEVYDAAPVNTAILVTTGHGDTALAIQMHYERSRRMAGVEGPVWTPDDEAQWALLANRVMHGLIFARVKGS